MARSKINNHSLASNTATGTLKAMKDGQPFRMSVDGHATEAEAIAARMYRPRTPPTPKPLTIRKFSWQVDADQR